MRKNSSFTPTQLLVLLGLIAVIIIIFFAGIIYVFAEKNSSIVIASPTNLLPATKVISPPTNLPPTVTIVPTFVYNSTFTPIPSPTSFLLTLAEPPTSIPQQSQNNPAPTNSSANPPAAKPAADCSAELDYAAAMHQYNLDSIDYIHQPMIDYYKSLIDEAIRSRDALSLVQAQRGLDNENSHMSAEKASENKRYKAERASINANCQ